MFEELFLFYIAGYIGDDEDRAFMMKTTAANENEALAKVIQRAAAAFEVGDAEIKIKHLQAQLN